MRALKKNFRLYLIVLAAICFIAAIFLLAPEPTASIIITALTPIIMPKLVRIERILFIFNDTVAIFNIDLKSSIIYPSPCPLPQGARARNLCFSGAVCEPFFFSFIQNDISVFEFYNSFCIFCNIRFVGYKYYCFSHFFIESYKKFHNFNTCFCV